MSASLLCLSYLSTKLLGLDRTVSLFARMGRTHRVREAEGTAQSQADAVTRGMQFLPLRIGLTVTAIRLRSTSACG